MVVVVQEAQYSTRSLIRLDLKKYQDLLIVKWFLGWRLRYKLSQPEAHKMPHFLEMNGSLLSRFPGKLHA